MVFSAVRASALYAGVAGAEKESEATGEGRGEQHRSV